MIILRKLEWSNFFSYGTDNTINFDESPLTQIVGKNGHGKSSIPIILEEVLYGKNSKGLKKSDIPNRNVNNAKLWAKLYFSVNNDNYIVEVKRSSTIKLFLFKNGSDISSHTSSATYKTIEKLVGLDFKTFSQLIYQSSTSSLQFLTATDTQRKQFLVNLFKLDKYTKLFEAFKKDQKIVQDKLSKSNGKVEILSTWLGNNKSWLSKSKKEELVVPEVPSSLTQEIELLREKLRNISEINKKIIDNNKYKELLLKIGTPPSSVGTEVYTEELQRQKIEKETLLSKKQAALSKLKSLKESICPHCYQEIDEELKSSMIQRGEVSVTAFTDEISNLDSKIQVARENNIKVADNKEKVKKFEQLSNYIDDSLPENIYTEKDLKNKIKELTDTIVGIEREQKEVISQNLEITKLNTTIEIKQKEYAENTNLLNTEKNLLNELNEEFQILEILKKVFSTTGLISYKLEYLVKDLEDKINEYLGELSKGNFQAAFILENDKLNIKILNNTNQVNVESLSAGELARVNIATLLAIRNLMSNISNTEINILFLDEILGVMDYDGKDSLVETLLDQGKLNAFLVAHEYTHPLVPKININKKEGISYIEE